MFFPESLHQCFIVSGNGKLVFLAEIWWKKRQQALVIRQWSVVSDQNSEFRRFATTDTENSKRLNTYV